MRVNGLNPQHEIEIAHRRSRALALIIDGFSYRNVASALGISLGQAYDDVQSELEALAALRRSQAETLRELSLERLDRWTLALAAKMRRGHVPAIHALVKIEERRAKLLGLDPPLRVAAEIPTAEPRSDFIHVDPETLSTETLRMLRADMERAAAMRAQSDAHVVASDTGPALRPSKDESQPTVVSE
jgi:hypothetical protein